MGKSSALKKRGKLVREGRLNPEINRSPFAQLDLRTRKTKNKKDRLYNKKHQNRHAQQWDDGSFLFAPLQHPHSQPLHFGKPLLYENHCSSSYLQRLQLVPIYCIVKRS